MVRDGGLAFLGLAGPLPEHYTEKSGLGET